MIIDFHTHLLDYGHWPDEWWDYVAREWASKQQGRTVEQIRGRIEEGLIDPDGSRMVNHMDAAGIDMAVILPIDWGPSFHSGRSIQDIIGHARECSHRHPTRLIPFAGIDPRRRDAPALLDKWLENGEYKGVKLYPNCGFYPDETAAMELYEVCLEHDVPILFHTGDPLPLLEKKYSQPQGFRQVVRRFPTLKAVFGHAGAPNDWEAMVVLAQASEMAVLELSVCLWDDSSERQELRLARLIAEARDRIGIERIVFGTDHVSGKRIRPAGFLSKVTEKFKRLPATAERIGVSLTEEEHAMIMGFNALRLLGMQPDDLAMPTPHTV